MTMHTVTELHAFRRAAERSGMVGEDIEDLVEFLSQNPDAGEEMPGTDGCRKLRFSIRGNNKGKSSGVRTITLYTGERLPVFLITVFAKNQKVSLDKGERNALKKLSEEIVREYARRVLPLASGEKT